MKIYRALLKAYFLSMITSISRKKNLRVPIFTGVLIAGGIVFYFITKLGLFVFSLRLPSYVASQINLPSVILNSVVLAMLIFLFLGSFSVILSSLYLSSDTKLILSMPVTQRTVFLSKFIFANLEEAIYPLVLVYPFFVAFGIKYNVSPIFYIVSFIFVMLLPLLPFSIAALIIIPIAKRVSIKKLQTIVLILNMILGISIYLISQIPNPAFHIINSSNLPTVVNKIQSVLRFIPTQLAVTFSFAFKNGKIFEGIIYALIYPIIGLALMYLAIILSEKNYVEGLFRAEKTESVKFGAKSIEKEIRVSKFLPKHISALVSKDIKTLMRDSRIKTSLFLSIGYAGFFFFVFIISPAKNAKGSFDAFILPLMYFVIVDFMLCGQNALIMLFLDRESIWVPFLAKIKDSEFIWSKFFLPFVSGELMNLILLIFSVFLLKNTPKLYILITFPFAIFLPLLFTASAIFVGMLFPNFKTPSDPRKLVPGKAALLNGLLYFIFVIGAVLLGLLGSFLVKLKGISFATLLMFLIVGILSVAISFPMLALAIKRFRELELSD